MSPLSKSLQQEAYEDLDGTVCQCGKSKARGHSFCPGCYFALPMEFRRKLYRRDGYPNTWDEAREQLRMMGRIK